MLTAVAVIFIVLSIGILIAHALEMPFGRISEVYLLRTPAQTTLGEVRDEPRLPDFR